MDAYTSFLDAMPNEILRETMIQMDAGTLQNICRVYKRASQKICNDETFWMKKYEHDFEGEEVVQAGSWKEAYDIRNASMLQIPWTGLKAQGAQMKCGFISVPEGHFKLATSINSTLDKNRGVVYHVGYRITGERQDVVNALTKAHVSEATIRQIMETAISYENKDIEPYATMLREERERCQARKSTARLPWTEFKAQGAGAKCAFVYVTKGGSKMASINMLQNQEMGIVYHLGYRIAGRREDVIDALRKANVNEETIRQIMETVVSYENKDTEPYVTMLREEIERCQTRR